MNDKIEEEKEKIRAERRTLVKDAILLIIAAGLLTAFLLIWKGQVTGMQVLEQEGFCSDYNGFSFISGQNITLSEDNDHAFQLKLSCLRGNITFHYDSDYIQISKSGLVSLVNKETTPAAIRSMIIARHESGEYIYKIFKFEQR